MHPRGHGQYSTRRRTSRSLPAIRRLPTVSISFGAPASPTVRSADLAHASPLRRARRRAADTSLRATFDRYGLPLVSKGDRRWPIEEPARREASLKTTLRVLNTTLSCCSAMQRGSTPIGGSITGPFSEQGAAVQEGIEAAQNSGEKDAEVIVQKPDMRQETVWRPSNT